MEKIPKTIHYCWFGNGEKSEKIKKCIESWRKYSDYEIVEWNEKNFNVYEHEYTKKAYEEKKWAFVSDYVRLKVLYDYGGIYLDTDVELRKPLDEFLSNDMFLGFMYDCNLATSTIGCKKKCKTINELLQLYETLELEEVPNNDLFTKFFIKKGLKLNNKTQVVDEVKIYPKEFFNYNFFGINNYAVHHFEDSWKEKNKKKELIKTIVRGFIGNSFYGKLSNRLAVKKSPFYSIYLNDKKEEV